MRALLLVLLLAAPVSAQEKPLFDWSPPARHAAAVTSDALLISQITFETVHSFRADNRWKAFGCQAARAGISIGLSEGLKRAVGRERPDGSDHFSWPSEHSWIGGSQGAWRDKKRLGVELGIMLGRQAAKKHYLTDTISGLLGGLATQFICRGE